MDHMDNNQTLMPAPTPILLLFPNSKVQLFLAF